MASRTHVLAFMEAAVEHLVASAGIGKRGAFVTVRADEKLAACAFGVVGTKGGVIGIKRVAVK